MKRGQAGRVASLLLLDLADRIEALAPAAASGADPEDLHQLRIAVRRSRSLLHGLKHVFPAADAERFGAEFKWLQQLTNPVRDLDVMLAQVEAAATGRPDMQRGLTAVQRQLSKRRTAERRKLKRGIESARARRLLDEWRECLIGPDGDGPRGRDAIRPVKKVAARRSARRYRRIARSAAKLAALDEPPPAELHALRKDAKDLRYFLEFFADDFDPAVARPLARDLKRMHQVLGGHQDRAVQSAMLREISAELAADTDALLAIGALLERIAAEADDTADDFAACAHSLAGKKRRAAVRAEFG